MYGEPLTREHGAPLRLILPTKLGYKQAKYIVGLRVSDVLVRSAATGWTRATAGTEDCKVRGAKVRRCDAASTGLSIRRSCVSATGRSRWRSAGVDRQRARGLRGVSRVRRQGSAVESVRAAVDRAPRRMARRGAAVALHVRVAADARNGRLRRLSDGQRQRTSGAVRARCDVRGVWPMARHYFLFGPKPPQSPRPTTRCRSWPTRSRCC